LNNLEHTLDDYSIDTYVVMQY